jgi:hypothetical protein
MRLAAALVLVVLSAALPAVADAQDRAVGQIYVRGPIQTPPGEPPSAVLLLTGVAGIFFVTRRKRSTGND